ncbi:MAG: hypothetical protein IPM57_10770 [Oligoflexia bacterium]|nr:hypothetical protein [Oligoflexia bacterium]
MLTLNSVRPVKLSVQMGNTTKTIVVFVGKEWSIDDILRAYRVLNPDCVIDVVSMEIQLDLLVDKND